MLSSVLKNTYFTGVFQQPVGPGHFSDDPAPTRCSVGRPGGPGAPPGEWRGVSNDAQAELTRANDILGGHPEQRLSRSAAMAGMAADRFQASLSPALGPARGLGAGPAKGGAEASRGGRLLPG